MSINVRNSNNRVCGTPGYISPEIFQKQYYTHKSDIFGVGCVFFWVLENRHLFVGEDISEILKKNLECDMLVVE